MIRNPAFTSIAFVFLFACNKDVEGGEADDGRNGPDAEDTGTDTDIAALGTDGEWTGVSRTLEEAAAQLMAENANIVEVLTHSDEISMTLQGDSGAYSSQAVSTYTYQDGDDACTMTRTDSWTGPVALVDQGDDAFRATVELSGAAEVVCETNPQLGWAGETDMQFVVDCTLSDDANSIFCSNADGNWAFSRDE